MVKNVKIYLLFLLFFWGLMLVCRTGFLIWQWSLLSAHSSDAIWHAFYIGLRFDGRVAAIISLPLYILLFMPWLARQFGKLKRLVIAFYAIILFLLAFVYVGDFANYAYLGERATWETLTLLKDINESLSMVWQTYPVIRLLLGAMVFIALTVLFFRWLFSAWLLPERRHLKYRLLPALCILVIALLIYGQYSLTYYPLRWSQAYFAGVDELTALGLNPVHNIYDSKPDLTKEAYSLRNTQKAYSLVADYLNVDEPYMGTISLRYERKVSAHETDLSQYNVVFIILESLSTHKSSFMFSNLDTTPFLKGLASESVYFPNFYANSRTTARAMFTIFTGIPDVTATFSSATRDPAAVDQHLIINYFKAHSKLFSLGGSANWANLRGLLANNIPDLEIYEESFWQGSKVDVWGITDLSLLLETHGLLLKQPEPFFSVTLTSGFHRPFTVPSGVAGFDYSVPDKKFLTRYGLVAEEYRSMRFTDFALRRYFEEARKSPYFENTIFILTGDHGISERSPSVGSNYQKKLRLNEFQVPLIIYCPKLFPEGQVVYHAGGHTDIFPTLASLMGIEYTNTTLGRDLFDESFGKDRMIFIRRTEKTNMVVGAGLAYMQDVGGDGKYFTKPEMVINGDWIQTRYPDVVRLTELQTLTKGLYESSRYLLHNNKKTAIQ